MKIYTADEIRKVEEKENEIGTKFLKLMEIAGTNCAHNIMELASAEDGKVVVVVGSGKNGGDGYVISRKLRENNYDVNVIMAFGPPKAEDAVKNHERAADADVPIIDYQSEKTYCEQLIGSAGLIVDTMFGIGFRGAANEIQTEVFELINKAAAKVVSVDIPSGVETDTGCVNGAAVQADITYAVSTLKPAHVKYPAREYCGKVEIVEIGLLPESFAAANPKLVTIFEDEAAQLLPVRSRTSHKNDFGHVLSICGSRRMPGAAVLCATAAIRTGAGLLTAAYPESAYASISPRLYEGMNLPLPESPDGMLSTDAIPLLEEMMEKASAIAIGPGLGRSTGVRTVVSEIIAHSSCPLVIDADALNAVSHNPKILKQCRQEIIITPHPGEMARLMGEEAGAVAADKMKYAKEFAEEYGVTVLLKGADTVVASKDGQQIYINTSGNQGLAKGGSGDTLTGIIAALAGEGITPFRAAALGAYIHGKCAEHAAEASALCSVKATDIIDSLPAVLKTIEQ